MSFERIKRLLPDSARARIRALLGRGPGNRRDASYQTRAEEEVTRFTRDLDTNALPPIFHYWSDTYIRRINETFGFSNPEDFYALNIARRRADARATRVLSIGAGACDTEVRVARMMLERGFSDFTITCLDLTPAALERGKADAQASGVADRFEFVTADFHTWRANQRFDVVMANQCLHHVVDLERLFDNVPTWLHERGALITSDIIGRNGHQRWPEARAIVDRFWEELPSAYRFNNSLQRQEDRFLDWDASVEGFEGIRAQDILPLLVERFGFEFFFGFGNVIDVFVDRPFGWNFDAEAEWDRSFIDRVHACDESEMDAGRLTPAHMLAVVTLDRSARPVVWRNRSPQASIRRP